MVDEIISGVVREQLRGVDVREVSVTPDLGSDGDPIFRVTVVYETPGDKLDPGSTVGLVRHIRSKLGEVGREEFPVVSFVSRKDAAKLKRKPA